MLYSVAIAIAIAVAVAVTITVLGRVCLLRKVVKDCLVGWGGAWQEIRQGSRGGLLRKEGRHEGADDWRRLPTTVLELCEEMKLYGVSEE